MANDYPEERTPVPGEDRDATVHARNPSHEAGYSAYGGGYGGYGGDNDGQGLQCAEEAGFQIEDIRQAVSRMGRRDTSPAPSAGRSRAGSAAGSFYDPPRSGSRTASRSDSRSSLVDMDLSTLRALSISTPTRDLENGASRPTSLHEQAVCDEPAVWIDPNVEPELRLIRHLGEGAGGAVDLVVEARSGQVMARKVGRVLGELC